ncbi:DUF2958 domain-containing protein [Pseudomonas aeruginosa]|uniref:DUF2958 domain-containing protein n=4 Tax=Gammaproteobacteria TaxID=1236 RepID=A0A365PPI6_9GAMM|nr:hypothetical protein CDL16_03600 [Pseudomonas aeruginosa]EED7004325.1 DUF2958 domain-containing protein [Salmonella enterica subsp. enterica serovar Braenderup]MBK3746967.1 DUF2958 domain-containing protein [Stutzerimonas balearica]MBU66839.1 DUF2958 domain-containing protein [Cupriavidus sp.]NKQ13363.1 DUF2958 domain-containing protein [Pseudomonas sp. SST3]QLW84772.1 DUF2958 domain-containing protein [Citrobacter freundii]RBA51565.1 DUF2958 domain-containing protein [Stutzerimonas zhaodo
MRISSNPWSHIRVFHGLHNSASALPCLYGFDGLRLRAFARKHASISPLPCFGRKAPPCIVGFVGAPTMTQPLITAEQHAQLLAVGEARANGQSIDPMPVVRLFTPDAHATWLLAALDPTDGDTAYGLIDLGIGMPALGTVKLSDLAAIVGPCKWPVMRDSYFQPARRLSEYVRLAQENGSIMD